MHMSEIRASVLNHSVLSRFGQFLYRKCDFITHKDLFSNNIFTKGFPNFMDFNFFNYGQKAETKSATPATPKDEKNIDDLMTQIDKLKKEVEGIKNQK